VTVFISLGVLTGCSVTILLCYSFILTPEKFGRRGQSFPVTSFYLTLLVGSFVPSFKVCCMPSM